MSDQHTILSGSHRYHRSGVEILGRADPHEWVEVTIKVRRKAALPEPMTGGAVMTREQLAANHGASEDDLNKVEQVLGTYGLSQTDRDVATRTVRMVGTVEQMEAVFNLHLFSAWHEGHTHRGRQGDIWIPKALDGIVVGVFGLDTRRMVRRRKGVEAVGAHALKPPGARAWFLPQKLAALYEFPNNGGAGQTIALLEFGGTILQSDLQAFASMANLPKVAHVEQVNVDALAPGDANDPNATGEVMLDVEVVAALCPDAKVVGYFAPFTEKGWVDGVDAAIHDTVRQPTVLAVSWGFAEGALIWTEAAMQALNEAMKEATILGIPVCLASGDDGSDDGVGDGAAHADFPATSPYVLSVGGTALNKKTGAEVVWKEGDGLRSDQGGVGGGGVSTVFARPAYQNGISIASVNPGAIHGRVIPNVCANAVGKTGYFTVANGQAGVVGGTSAAAPLWAALIARMDTARGKGVGFLTPLLYQANPKPGGKPLGNAALKDITQGNNTSAAAGGYSAAPGYDAASGWGSPNGTKLLSMLP